MVSPYFRISPYFELPKLLSLGLVPGTSIHKDIFVGKAP